MPPFLPHSAAPRRVLAYRTYVRYAPTMGYRGKVEQQEQARVLRAREPAPSPTSPTQLGVSKSSVSLWVRDVPFTPSKRRHGPRRRPHPQQRRQARSRSRRCDAEGRARHRRAGRRGVLRRRRRALRGRGSEAGRLGVVREHRSGDDPVLLRVAAPLLRDRRVSAPGAGLPPRGPRSRRRRGVLVGAHRRFRARSSASAYRAVADPTHPAQQARARVLRTSCYSCSRTHRAIMGLRAGAAIVRRHSGVAQSAEQLGC